MNYTQLTDKKKVEIDILLAQGISPQALCPILRLGVSQQALCPVLRSWLEASPQALCPAILYIPTKSLLSSYPKLVKCSLIVLATFGFAKNIGTEFWILNNCSIGLFDLSKTFFRKTYKKLKNLI